MNEFTLLTKTFGNQNSKSPKILIIGGIHGDEYTSLVLLDSLCKRLENNSTYLENFIEVIPFVNILGMFDRNHLFFDNNQLKKDSAIELNRSFNLDLQIIKQLKEKISNADIVIDIHAHQFTVTLPYAVILNDPNRPEIANKQFDLIRDLGINYGEEHNYTNTRISGTMIKHVLASGKKATIIELSNLNEIKDRSFDTILNRIFEYCTNLHISTENYSSNNNEFKYVETFKNKYSGLVSKKYIKLGDYVKKGDKLFEIIVKTKDGLNWKRINIKSEKTGTVITLPLKIPVLKGYTSYRLSVD